MKLTPIKAIKRYCKIKCCNEDMLSWKECSVTDCPLYAYRLGKRPKNDELAHSSKAKQGILEGRGDTNGME